MQVWLRRTRLPLGVLASWALLGPSARAQEALPAQRGTDPARQTAGAAPSYDQLLPVRGKLRVCADPNALPYSNEAQQGFENKLAELIARDFHAAVSYTWFPQRRGFVRNTLNENECDLIMGVPSTLDMVLTTIPYYRSSYVFIYRKDRGLHINSLDDPALKQLKIGVYMFGDDYNNTPPVHGLVERGVDPEHIVGYSLYGDYARPNPPADLIDAVGRGEVDLAIGWGPIAGYFAQHQPVALDIVPVTPSIDLPFRPYVYDMSLGVRHEDKPLKEALDEILSRHRTEIRQLLLSYGVPLVDARGGRSTAQK